MLRKIFAALAVVFLILSCSAPAPEAPQIVLGADVQEMSLGLGQSPIFRVGPGKDSTGTQVYSFTYVMAAVVFDGDGKIASLEVDELEVSTPNYDGASMPHFPGWPGSPELNLTNHETEKVEGTAPTTEAAVAEAVGSWITKRDRGDNYGMNKNRDWWNQMDAWEALFVGKTVDEVEEFYAKYTNDSNRPINPDSTDPAEKKLYNSLSKDEKQVLADVRTGATMAINDGHGYVLSAIRNAWDKESLWATDNP